MQTTDPSTISKIVESLRNKQSVEPQPTTFIPYDLSFLKKERGKYMITATLIMSIFIYLISYALIVDAFYYWHIDVYVIIGLFTISLFLFLGLFFLNQTLKKHALIQQIEHHNRPIFGIYLFKDLLIELRLHDHIYFNRENVNQIILSELKGADRYVELEIRENGLKKIIGFKTDNTNFDLIEWINNRSN